ncbi:exodeoxyribonuclease VII small subunit [Halomonas sp. HP20-15]|uniref:exodeoxyribonuclease VII small subunit n=1 Tax=Halomonas sp. HP20-15 TaxID=3085901 RepID=UPI002981BC78|nr:exodeoxyribonuclease VII small subunit [Halomonas sp. HP20-15]MDW5375814.1 exodeoxyribonuclease VII small subunit [Halomonas sp. HP20-15]
MADKHPAAPVDSEAPPEDFAATLERLEALVGELEAGELTLEASLAAFEQGVRLTRDAQRRLDAAELKVQALVEQPDGRFEATPFTAPNSPSESGNDR